MSIKVAQESVDLLEVQAATLVDNAIERLAGMEKPIAALLFDAYLRGLKAGSAVGPEGLVYYDYRLAVAAEHLVGRDEYWELTGPIYFSLPMAEEALVRYKTISGSGRRYRIERRVATRWEPV
jgi:hypothetical protein